MASGMSPGGLLSTGAARCDRRGTRAAALAGPDDVPDAADTEPFGAELGAECDDVDVHDAQDTPASAVSTTPAATRRTAWERDDAGSLATADPSPQRASVLMHRTLRKPRLAPGPVRVTPDFTSTMACHRRGQATTCWLCEQGWTLSEEPAEAEESGNEAVPAERPQRTKLEVASEVAHGEVCGESGHQTAEQDLPADPLSERAEQIGQFE